MMKTPETMTVRTTPTTLNKVVYPLLFLPYSSCALCIHLRSVQIRTCACPCMHLTAGKPLMSGRTLIIIYSL